MTPLVSVSELQWRLQDAMDDMVALDDEVGLQVSVHSVDGWCVDLAAGFTGRRNGRPVDLETLFPVFSATKAVAATALHIQVARGESPTKTGSPDTGENSAAEGSNEPR